MEILGLGIIIAFAVIYLIFIMRCVHAITINRAIAEEDTLKKKYPYELRLNDQQLVVLLEALDFYTRILAGQHFEPWNYIGQTDDLRKTREAFKELFKGVDNYKRLLFGIESSTANVGIAEMNNTVKQAYDIYRAVHEELVDKSGDVGHHNVYSSKLKPLSKDGKPYVRIDD